jgi:chromosome segregation ATPase
MGHGSIAIPRRYLIAALLTLVLLSAAALLAAQPSAAQADPKQNPSPDVQFSQQLDELKKSFGDVGRQIDESAKSIDTIKSPEEGRKSIEELRGQVAKLLDAVADNGEISKLGGKALALAEEKLKSLDRETRFKPEEKQYLLNRWRELRAATETAIRDLDGARKDFAELLRSLQTSEDYIDELMQIREHEKALQVIHQLSDGIRDASVKLKKLLGSIKPPGV